jgi:hypothetical protein
MQSNQTTSRLTQAESRLNHTLARLGLAEQMNAALEDGLDELRRNDTERGIARLSTTTKHLAICPPAPATSGQIEGSEDALLCVFEEYTGEMVQVILTVQAFLLTTASGNVKIPESV